MEVLEVERLEDGAGVVEGHLLEEEDLDAGVAHVDDVLIEVGRCDVEGRVVDDPVTDVGHGRLLRRPLGLGRRLISDERTGVTHEGRELLLVVGDRPELPAARGRGRAEAVGQLGGGLVQVHRYVGNLWVLGQDGSAEVVLEGEAADHGEVRQDVLLCELPVGSARIVVVAAVDHDLATGNPTLGVHVGGVGLGPDQRPLEETGEQGGHVADAHGGSGESGAIAEGRLRDGRFVTRGGGRGRGRCLGGRAGGQEDGQGAHHDEDPPPAGRAAPGTEPIEPVRYRVHGRSIGQLSHFPMHHLFLPVSISDGHPPRWSTFDPHSKAHRSQPAGRSRPRPRLRPPPSPSVVTTPFDAGRRVGPAEGRRTRRRPRR